MVLRGGVVPTGEAGVVVIDEVEEEVMVITGAVLGRREEMPRPLI